MSSSLLCFFEIFHVNLLLSRKKKINNNLAHRAFNWTTLAHGAKSSYTTAPYPFDSELYLDPMFLTLGSG